MYLKQTIGIAFKNGRVITVDSKNTLAQAVGISGNKIVFVGSDAELEPLLSPDTKVINLKGRTLMPGINDTHFHPILNGLLEPGIDSGMIDTTYKNCKSIAQLLEMVRAAANDKEPGEWISMMGYEPSLLPEQRHPTIEELDAAAPNNPVHCMHGGGHICMYNHKALEYLGVFGPEDAAKYPKDEVEVVNGRLTGLVRGHTHFWLWGQVAYTEEQQKRAAMKSHQQCLEAGITSVGDMGECDAPSYHVMQKLCRDGVFKVRVSMALHSIFGKPFSKADNEYFLKLGFMTGLGDEHFRVGPCKFMIDGGAGGPSCATREPYSHDPTLPRERGWGREEVAEYIQMIEDHECQATAHAIGDEAVEFMVEGYEKAFAKAADKEAFRNRRHRIEHASLTDQDLIERMAKMNICPSVNAGMVQMLGASYMHFFGERFHYHGALRSMLDAGVICSLHSDAPSGPVGLQAIDGCVNRIDRVKGVQCPTTQAISVMEAIRIATYNGAYSTHEESIKGSIELGKLADLVVLSDDILAIDPGDIYLMKVDMTMIDGQIEYERMSEADNSLQK